MSNQHLSDRQRVELTQKAYEELNLGEIIAVGRQEIGKVVQSVLTPDGMRAYVILNANEITILYKGSFGLIKGTPQTWRDEWLKTNLPVLAALLSHQRLIPQQLKSARRLLNQCLRTYPGLRLYVYGHSLGSINAQYALAGCHQPRRLAAAYLYEGTNIWQLLTPKERATAAKMREKIFNYVDIYDPVTLGITASHHMVGKLQYVDSEQLPPIKQHMWGGYHFDQTGKLQLRSVDSAFLTEAASERKFLNKSENLSTALRRLDQEGYLKQRLRQKLQQFKTQNRNSGMAALFELFFAEEKNKKKWSAFADSFCYN